MLLTMLLMACTPDAVEGGKGGRPGGAGARDTDTASGDTADSAEMGGDTADTAPDDTGGEDLPEWTLLVFVNGDNDLETYALGDLNEMEVVGSTEDVNVVVQLDRSKRESRADGDWSGARRYLVGQDDDPRVIGSPVLEDLGEIDSGSVDTVLDFVEWGAATFPARRYALVLWNHGDGWFLVPDAEVTKGISYDDGAGTYLSVAGGDVTDVVAGAEAALGGPIDLMGFDACTMQQWEVASSVAPHAEYLVASQDYEAGDGWPYDAVLADLVAAPAMEAPALGATIALRFHEIPDSTMSVLDLGALEALSDALDEVADAVVATGTANAILRTAAEGAQGYDGPRSRDHDLVHLLERIDATTEDAAVHNAVTGALAAAESVVLTNYNRGGAVKNSYGLSIFSPVDPSLPPIYANAAWSRAHRWDEMLAAAAE